MLGKHDKGLGMSDTAYHRDLMRETFSPARHGSVKAAIYAAHRFISPIVTKEFTHRRARSIWEGTARRIDAEEAAALRKAQIEETRREYRELQNRVASLAAALAVADAEFHGPKVAAHSQAPAPLGRMDRAGSEGR